jgi:hypothetical protein
MDVNEDIYRKSIGRSLTNLEGLNMREAVGEFTGKKIGLLSFKDANLWMGFGLQATLSSPTLV